MYLWMMLTALPGGSCPPQEIDDVIDGGELIGSYHQQN